MPTMHAAKPSELKKLRAYTEGKSEALVLREYIKRTESQPALLKDALLVALHRTWSEHPPYELTEVGIATFDRRKVDRAESINLGPHAGNLLECVWSMHLRIGRHGHLPSADSDPEAYHFGRTVFVSEAECLRMLHLIWHQYLDDEKPVLGFRPVLCLNYGNNDSVAVSRKDRFNFMPMTINTTVGMLNARNMAVSTLITDDRALPLDRLLGHFYVRTFHINNAGNAAMYTMAAAFLCALRRQLYHDTATNPDAEIGSLGASQSKCAQAVMHHLMQRPTPTPPFGTRIYCTVCDSTCHLESECRLKNEGCSRCLRSPKPWRQANGFTHTTRMCVSR